MKNASQSSSNGDSGRAASERVGKYGKRRQPSCHSSLVKLKQEMFNMKEAEAENLPLGKTADPQVVM